MRRIKKVFSLLLHEPGQLFARLSFKFNEVQVIIFDIFHRTNFSGRLYWDEIGTTKERANDYSASPKNILKTLKRMDISESDSIIDMGCGKGLAMYYMSKFPFGKIAGIELSESLLKMAKKNLKEIGGASRVIYS